MISRGINPEGFEIYDPENCGRFETMTETFVERRKGKVTEEQAKEKGYDVKTSVLPLDAVPRAIVNRETTGVFKLVADAETLKVLGVHIVSENAGDVIYAASLAVKFGLTIEDLTETLAPYLTMAEGLKLVALTFDKDISKLSCCAG